MPDRETRFYWQNLLNMANTSAIASSYEPGMPPAFARDPQKSKAWRSRRGWNIVRAVNDCLCIDEGGTNRFAFIEKGNYPTGALAATAIKDAMNAAGIDPRELSASLWLRADSLLMTLNDAALVSQWSDESGNSRHLTQATDAKKPIFHRSILNGRPALYFDGAADQLVNTSATLDDLIDSTAGCWFVVFYRPSTASGAATVFGGHSSTNTLRLDGSGNLVARCNDGAQKEASKAAADGSWHIGVWLKDGSSYIGVGVDDQDTAALVGTAAGAISSLTETLVLGSDGSAHFKGYVAEVIVFPATFSEENLRRVTAYLKQKYALSDDATSDATWGNAYAVDYSTSTNKFTIARDTGADSVSLLWNSGFYASRDVAEDIGYSASADDTGGTSYVADTVSYHSCEWLRYDLASAMAVKSALVTGHVAAATGGDIKIQGNSVDDWTNPTVNESLTADTADSIRAKDFTSQTLRYWRILISDTQNTNGYSQIGARFVGGYFEPYRSARIGYSDDRDDLSQFKRGDFGAYFNLKKDVAGEWVIAFDYLPKTDKANFDLIEKHLGVGGALWVTLDRTEVRYVVWLERLRWRHHIAGGDPPDHFSTSLAFGEIIR